MKVIILGAGKHAAVICDILNRHSEFKILGFVDKKPTLSGNKVNGFPILGDDTFLDNLKDKKSLGLIIGIGNQAMNTRKSLYSTLTKRNFNFINAIDSTAIISKTATIGKGNFIAAGVIINSFSQIGNNTVINTGSIVEHNNLIENNVYISPGVVLSGSVKLRDGAFVGSGAVILPQINVGNNSIIGAGAVVTKDVPANAVMVGVPAKIIRYNS